MSFEPAKYPYLTSEDRAVLALVPDLDLTPGQVPLRLGFWRCSTVYLQRQKDRLRRLGSDLYWEGIDHEMVVTAVTLLYIEIAGRHGVGGGRFSYGGR
jgi:hypothetical protein